VSVLVQGNSHLEGEGSHGEEWGCVQNMNWGLEKGKDPQLDQVQMIDGRS